MHLKNSKHSGEHAVTQTAQHTVMRSIVRTCLELAHARSAGSKQEPLLLYDLQALRQAGGWDGRGRAGEREGVAGPTVLSNACAMKLSAESSIASQVPDADPRQVAKEHFGGEIQFEIQGQISLSPCAYSRKWAY
jgi:hypothetical protein